MERKGAVPFYASGKWRFVQRVRWWDEYDEPTPVVIGHCWRRPNKIDRDALGKGDPDLFGNTSPLDRAQSRHRGGAGLQTGGIALA